MSTLEKRDFKALGTSCRIVTDVDAQHDAYQIVEQVLKDVDKSCSRFRSDSELSLVNHRAGRWVSVSATFSAALSTALRAAHITRGAVDPTIGTAIRFSGYDRDFSRVTDSDRPVAFLESVPGWQAIEFDRALCRVKIPFHTELDFGATAKALAADMAATKAAQLLRTGVLVSLGGDIAASGPPPSSGWDIAISDAHDSNEVQQVVSITGGGVATSSTTRRTWRRGDQQMHHIIDPKTAKPAEVVWRTVSVTAANCVDANIASTASVVMGEQAAAWLSAQHLDARLVRANASTVYVGGWPKESS